MVGIELDRPCTELVGRALEEQQLLITVTQGSVIRLLPPLICDEGQIDAIVARIVQLLSAPQRCANSQEKVLSHV